MWGCQARRAEAREIGCLGQAGLGKLIQIGWSRQKEAGCSEMKRVTCVIVLAAPDLGLNLEIGS